MIVTIPKRPIVNMAFLRSYPNGLLIREIEMKVEGCLSGAQTGYAMQFWRDVNLYGLAEAYLYLVKFVGATTSTSQVEALQELALRIVAIVASAPKPARPSDSVFEIAVPEPDPNAERSTFTSWSDSRDK